MMGKNKPNIKILVACHKADPNIRQDDIYMPIHVGKALHPEIDLGFQCDNTGDNISEKNESYCELTAIYWAWKNLKNVDYIGLCHYRRYFDLDITPQKIEKLLLKYDAIAIKRTSLTVPAISELTQLLCQEDATIAVDTLINDYPEFYNSALKYLFRNNRVSQCNMFIMKWKDFDEYCKFLFAFLGKVEKKLLPHSYSRLKRNIGYIAENFQGLYFLNKNYKIKYVQKDEIGETKTSLSEYTKRIKNIRNKVLFNLVNKPTRIKFYDSVTAGLKQDGIEIYL